MQKRSLLFLSLLVPAFLGLGGYAVVQGQQKGSPAAGAKRWSDAATWPDKKVPAKDALVTITKDMNVVMDVSPMPLHGLTIEGKLSFADDKDLELTTEWIMVHGELEIGTEAKPHTKKATITLTDNVKDEDISGVGGTTDRVDRGIMLMGGTLNLHGSEKSTWTKLAKTAEAGSTSIEVLSAADWKAGEEIVLASTDFDPRQAERRTITAVHANNGGNTITLDKKLDYMHFGKITFDVDERGEVAHADAQYQTPGIGRRGTVLLRRARHGDGRKQDVCRGRRIQSNGPEHDSRPISDPLASGRRRTGAVHQERRRSTTPTTAA